MEEKRDHLLLKNSMRYRQDTCNLQGPQTRESVISVFKVNRMDQTMLFRCSVVRCCPVAWRCADGANRVKEAKKK